MGRSSSSTYAFAAGGVSGMCASESLVRFVTAVDRFSDTGGDSTRVFLRASVFTGRVRFFEEGTGFVSISPSRSSMKSLSAAVTTGWMC